MGSIIDLTIKIFLIIAIGYGAMKLGIITKEMQTSLSSLLVNLLCPLNILAASQEDFSMEHFQGVLITGVIAVVYYISSLILGLFVGKKLKLPEEKREVLLLLTMFANTGFIGFSIINEVTGTIGMLYAVIYNCIFNIFFFSAGVYQISKVPEQENTFQWNTTLKMLASNILVWLAVISIILYLLPWRFPKVMTNSLSTIGSMMLPTSLLIIGSQLAEMNLREILFSRDAYVISFLRMILYPSITLILMKLLQVDKTVATTVVILAALPSGSMNVIFAQKYNKAVSFATASLMQTMLVMLVTLPLFITLCSMYL